MRAEAAVWAVFRLPCPRCDCHATHLVPCVCVCVCVCVCLCVAAIIDSEKRRALALQQQANKASELTRRVETVNRRRSSVEKEALKAALRKESALQLGVQRAEQRRDAAQQELASRASCFAARVDGAQERAKALALEQERRAREQRAEADVGEWPCEVWLCGCVAVWLCGCVAVWLWMWQLWLWQLWLCARTPWPHTAWSGAAIADSEARRLAALAEREARAARLAGRVDDVAAKRELNEQQALAAALEREKAKQQGAWWCGGARCGVWTPCAHYRRAECTCTVPQPSPTARTGGSK